MLTKKVFTIISKFKLVNIGDKIIVCVSGGPDSLCLLYVLNSLKEELGLFLYVAHLNHMMRGRESEKDFLFVKKTAEKLKLPFLGGKASVKKAHKKGSIEEVARNIRLKFFIKEYKRIKADAIALGHTKDDQAETVLMRLLRGTGLYGLRAILPKRIINSANVIRPLLGIERKEINAYLKKVGVKPREDSTNEKDIYFRNKIRKNLIPFLEKNYNPQVKDVLFDLAENISLDFEYLKEASSAAAHKSGVRILKNSAEIELRKFQQLHLSLQRMILRQIISELSGTQRRLRYKHWREFQELILSRPVNSVVDLPHKIKAVKKPAKIIISSINT